MPSARWTVRTDPRQIDMFSPTGRTPLGRGLRAYALSIIQQTKAVAKEKAGGTPSTGLSPCDRASRSGGNREKPNRKDL